MRAWLVVVSVGLLAAAARPADACSKIHETPLDLFERAAVVARVKVLSVPGPRAAGPVPLKVLSVIKGHTRRRLVAQETNTSCRAGFRRGRQALVFLDRSGDPVGHYEGYLEDRSGGVDWLPVLRAYAAAADDDARLAVVIDAIAKAPPKVADDAAFFLMRRPSLLVRVTASQRALLAKALGAARDRSPLVIVLARLRQPGLDAVLRKRQLTYGDVARRLLSQPRFDSVTDRRKLADAIAGGHGESDPTRIVALERCEMLVGRRLDRWTMYFSGVAEHYWSVLAKACRNGAPAP